MKKIILLSLWMTQFFTSNVFADNELKTSDVFVTATRTPIAKKMLLQIQQQLMKRKLNEQDLHH